MKKLLVILVAVTCAATLSFAGDAPAAKAKGAKADGKECCSEGNKGACADKSKGTCPMQAAKEKAGCCSEGGKQAAKRPISTKGGPKLAQR